jgi:hypothetical protein
MVILEKDYHDPEVSGREYECLKRLPPNHSSRDRRSLFYIVTSEMASGMRHQIRNLSENDIPRRHE